MNRITDTIWIGNSWDARQYDALKVNGIDSILNCAHDLNAYLGWDKLIHHSHCGMVDGPGNPLSSYTSAILQLAALVKIGKKVLVHCHKGHSRSVAVVIGHQHLAHGGGWGYHRTIIRSQRNTPDDTPHPALKEELFDKVDWDALRKLL